MLCKISPLWTLPTTKENTFKVESVVQENTTEVEHVVQNNRRIKSSR